MEKRTNKILSIPAEKRFLSKQECMNEARRILKEGLLDGMSESQIAREIYFHAVVYHLCLKFRRKPAIIRWIEGHADPIDLCSGGDYPVSRALFAASWAIPSVKRGNSEKERKR